MRGKKIPNKLLIIQYGIHVKSLKYLSLGDSLNEAIVLAQGEKKPREHSWVVCDWRSGNPTLPQPVAISFAIFLFFSSSLLGQPAFIAVYSQQVAKYTLPDRKTRPGNIVYR